MANNIAFAENFIGLLDEVYQRESVSGCLNSDRGLIRASRHARDIQIPMISVTGLGDYTRNVGYKTGSISVEVIWVASGCYLLVSGSIPRSDACRP